VQPRLKWAVDIYRYSGADDQVIILNRISLIVPSVKLWGGDDAVCVAIVVAALLIVPTGVTLGDNQGRMTQSLPNPPVMIIGDDNLTARNYVSAGTGTEDNPFVISGLSILSSTSWKPLRADFSFLVMNTTRHLLVSEIRIGPSTYYPDSVSLFVIWNCSNIRVVESEARSYGALRTLLIRNSSHIEISENSFNQGAYTSISIENSSDIVIERNMIWGGSSTTGILVQSSSSVQIRENYIQYCAIGVDLRDSADVDISGCIMKRNAVDFVDDNPEGANSYSESRSAFLWSDTKSYLTTVVLAVEAIMLFAAVWMIRSRDRGATKTGGSQADDATGGGPGGGRHV
jgi:hypothetical protein